MNSEIPFFPQDVYCRLKYKFKEDDLSHIRQTSKSIGGVTELVRKSLFHNSREYGQRKNKWFLVSSPKPQSGRRGGTLIPQLINLSLVGSLFQAEEYQSTGGGSGCIDFQVMDEENVDEGESGELRHKKTSGCEVFSSVGRDGRHAGCLLLGMDQAPLETA